MGVVDMSHMTYNNFRENALRDYIPKFPRIMCSVHSCSGRARIIKYVMCSAVAVGPPIKIRRDRGR